MIHWTSVRVRLTLWNTGVLAAMLAAFGAAIYWDVSASQAAGVDRDLAERAHHAAADWARRGPGPGRPPFGGGMRPGPGFAGEPGPPPPGGWMGRRPRRMGPPPPMSSNLPTPDFTRPKFLPAHDSIHPPPPFRYDPPWDPDTVAPAAAGREGYSTVTLAGQPVRVFSAPIRRGGEIIGVVQVARSLKEQQRLHAGLLRTLLTLLPLGMVIAALGGLFLTRRALRPVQDITQAAGRIGVEDLSQRLPVAGGDEFSALAATFNSMIERLQLAFEELRSAYEQQRRFTSDASHELRTPLTAIKANTSLALADTRTPEEYRLALREADEAADLMTRTIQDLLLLARSDAGQLRPRMEPIALARVLERAARVVGHHEGAPLEIQLPPEPLCVEGDEQHLTRLFANLLENALFHTPREGRITVRARRVRGDAVVTVEDTGEGIPPDALPHVCERFYRVDAARSRAVGGSGLGLAICKSIVEAHGGKLAIDSRIGKGTTVRVTLPGLSPGVETGQANDAEPAPAGRL